MKGNLLYAASLMTVITFTACNDDMNETLATEGHFTVEASMEHGSRTALNDDNQTVVWSEGDKIYLFGGNSYATMSLDKGVGEMRGEFIGHLNGKTSELTTALYPIPEVKDGKYTYELPAERT